MLPTIFITVGLLEDFTLSIFIESLIISVIGSAAFIIFDLLKIG